MRSRVPPSSAAEPAEDDPQAARYEVREQVEDGLDDGADEVEPGRDYAGEPMEDAVRDDTDAGDAAQKAGQRVEGVADKVADGLDRVCDGLGHRSDEVLDGLCHRMRGVGDARSQVLDEAEKPAAGVLVARPLQIQALARLAVEFELVPAGVDAEQLGLQQAEPDGAGLVRR
jgi:hypothetical protein